MSQKFAIRGGKKRIFIYASFERSEYDGEGVPLQNDLQRVPCVRLLHATCARAQPDSQRICLQIVSAVLCGMPDAVNQVRLRWV